MSSNAAAADGGVLARLRQISRLYAEIAELPLSETSDAKLRAQADAGAKALLSAQEFAARAAATADASGAADRDGAVSAKAWLAQRGVPFRDAARAHEQGSAMTPQTEP